MQMYTEEMEKTVPIRVRRKTRTRLKVLAAKEGQTYDEAITKLLDA